MNAIQGGMMANAWLKRMLVLVVIGYTAAPALAQNCRLDIAENFYRIMQLPETITLLEDCQDQDLEKSEQIKRLRLLAFPIMP